MSRISGNARPAFRQPEPSHLWISRHCLGLLLKACGAARLKGGCRLHDACLRCAFASSAVHTLAQGNCRWEKNLRACCMCGMLKNEDMWLDYGCDNCPFLLPPGSKDVDRVHAATTALWKGQPLLQYSCNLLFSTVQNLLHNYFCF